MAISADKTKLYVDRSVTPNKGITLDEIAACLKDYRVTALGRDLGLLATSPNINPWAKWKPVTWNTIEPLKTIDYAYRGIDGKCGVEIPIIKQSDFDQGADHVLNLIQHANSPSLIRAQPPYRMMDFDGYLHLDDLNGQFEWYEENIYFKTSGADSRTLRIGTFATNANSLSQDHLTLIDLMQRFKNKIGWTDINGNTSYGYLGVLLIYENVVDDVKSMALCSHSCEVNPSVGSPYELSINFSTVYDEEGGTAQIKSGTNGFLIPCIVNYNTNGKWVAVGLNSSVNYLECAILPFSGKTYQMLYFIGGSKPVVQDLIRVYAVYGGTVNESKKNITVNKNAGFLGITLETTADITSDATYYYEVVGGSPRGVQYSGDITFSASTKRGSLPSINPSKLAVQAGVATLYSGSIIIYLSKGSNTIIGEIIIS